MLKPSNILLGPEYTWQLLRALEKLRTAGQTDSQLIQRSPVYGRYHRQQLLEPKPGRPHLTVARPGFADVYDRDIRPYYEDAQRFLQAYGLDIPQARFTLDDVVRLQHVANECLAIVTDELSRETIGTLYFDSAKALKKQTGLNAAVLDLLGWKSYPQLQHLSEEAIWVSGHPTARLVLLCENQHYLLQYQKALAQEIELRHAGGNNTRKLQHAPDPGLTFCYCGDWDYDGLRMYRDVYAIHLHYHGRRARLLTPPPTTKRLRVGTKGHGSRWPPDIWKQLAHPSIPLDELFDKEQLDLINSLHQADEWIEEEAIKFDRLLEYNGLLKNT
jgi:hypothetical protein